MASLPIQIDGHQPTNSGWTLSVHEKKTDRNPIATYVARLQRFGFSDAAHEARDQTRAAVVYSANVLGRWKRR